MKKACILLLIMLVCMGNMHTVYAGSMDAALLPADVKDLDFDEELYYGEEIMQKEDQDNDSLI